MCIQCIVADLQMAGIPVIHIPAEMTHLTSTGVKSAVQDGYADMLMRHFPALKDTSAFADLFVDPKSGADLFVERLATLSPEQRTAVLTDWAKDMIADIEAVQKAYMPNVSGTYHLKSAVTNLRQSVGFFDAK